ncbi:hypothetical protein FEM48_Zijuj02G0037300 [Ziziphus jujuba var. spinosa]|uniref:Uncharacterized protein n=1 Tax=Ziziphus jujuba var. spinosa TaxID=714518 RepID=A0A978VTF4_ZIZJJ|nr:hypothetical protein FEM48_Zijuj02G0037300 [Ziziphus jujuba var. spinosa]
MMSRMIIIKLEANEVHTICGFSNNCGDECSYGDDLGSGGTQMPSLCHRIGIATNISFKAAKIRFGFGNWQSNPRPIGIYSQPTAPLAYHNEEEAPKKSEKKQFPLHTRYIAFVVLAIVVGTRNISDDNTTLFGWFHFECSYHNRNKKATIYYDTLNASSRFSDKIEKLASLENGFTLEPGYSMPINYKFRAEV